MSGALEWSRALAERETGTFSLTFSRLGLTAECHRLSTGEIGEAMAMGGETAARYLLYLACPALQEAGEALRREEQILSPFDITLRLAYSDVLQAASFILEQSGGAEAMVTLELPEGSDVPAPAAGQTATPIQSDCAPQEILTAAEGHFSAWRGAWEAAAAPGAALSPVGMRPVSPPAPQGCTPEQVALELASRLADAAGNM